MASTGISWQGIGLRFIAAAILVFVTYNPDGYSYFHWAIQPLIEAPPDTTTEPNRFTQSMALKIFIGVVLVIGWTVFLRATLRSLGAFGLMLALAFFGTLTWLIVDLGIIPANSVRAISYIVMVILCGVLAVGVSWSHIRRRISGQVDTDDLETE